MNEETSRTALNARQRKYLRGLAHHLEPTVRIGQKRVTDALVRETERALESHELVKVRVETEDRGERAAAATELAERSGSQIVGAIGKIAILYRRREDEPAIQLPS
ncbi:MAG TPA: ribosome assembly RNA-binding protein YhbY [Thermoanaerobaculia bacterium]|nr:ribosome assembly RNA-binding protein YhbY [Thermoanaerobaculia bacterium]